MVVTVCEGTASGHRRVEGANRASGAERGSNAGGTSVGEGGSELIQGAADLFTGRWWLVHVKPRNEKALAADLDRLGLRRFLPLARMVRRYGRRRLVVELPLFPGYLFFAGSDEQRLAAYRTRRAVRVIEVVDQARLQEDLRHIHRVTSSGETVDVAPKIQRGRRCRVVGGPMRGVEGVVLRRRDVFRVYVAVHALGQSAELEIDPTLLEVID